MPPRTYEPVEGVFTATVNTVANFKADKIYWSAGDELIIVGVDENSEGPLRLIEMRLAPDIPNGRHSYPGEQIRQLNVAANTAPAHYLTDSGYVDVDFDREHNAYKGTLEIKATDLFSSKTIEVVAAFCFSTGTIPILKHK